MRFHRGCALYILLSYSKIKPRIKYVCFTASSNQVFELIVNIGKIAAKSMLEDSPSGLNLAQIINLNVLFIV